MPGRLCRGGVGGGGESMPGPLTYWLGITGGMLMGGGMFGVLSSAASSSASLTEEREGERERGRMREGEGEGEEEG